MATLEKRITNLEGKTGKGAPVICVDPDEARMRSERGEPVILVTTGIDRAPNE